MVIPVKKSEELAFFEQRAPIWVANAAALGITPKRAAQLETLTTSARTAFDTASTARAQSKAATSSQNEALKAMRDLGSELIKQIRTTADIEGDPSLFGLAQIPEPKDPAPIPPVEASDVRFDLLNDGSLELAWDGSVSTGTSYVVRAKKGETITPGTAPITVRFAIGGNGQLEAKAA